MRSQSEVQVVHRRGLGAQRDNVAHQRHHNERSLHWWSPEHYEHITSARWFAIGESIRSMIIWFVVSTSLLRSIPMLYWHVYSMRLKIQMDALTSDDLKGREQLALEIQRCKESSLWLGPTFREIGSLGLLIYSIQVYLPLVYISFGYICSRQIKHTLAQGVLIFINDERTARRQICDRLEAILNQIIHSNMNFTEQLIGRHRLKVGPMSEHHRHDSLREFAESNQAETSSASDKLSRTNKTRHVVRTSQPEMSSAVNLDRFVKYSRAVHLAASMRTQLTHLNNLRQHKWLLWPENRTLEWRQTLTKFALLSYVGIVTFLLFCAHLFYHVLIVTSEGAILRAQYVNASSQNLTIASDEAAKSVWQTISDWMPRPHRRKLDNGEPVFTLVDRISIMCGHVFLHEAITSSFGPLLSFAVCLVDFVPMLLRTRRMLNTLKQRLIDFRRVGAWGAPLERMRDNVSDKRATSLANAWLLQRQELEQPARNECDLLAIETYVHFKMFVTDTRVMLDWYELNNNRLCLQIIGSFLALASAMPQIDIHQLRVLALMIGFIMLSTNVTIILVASISSACYKCNKEIWALIAHSIERPRDVDAYRVMTNDDEIELERLVEVGSDKRRGRRLLQAAEELSTLNGSVTPHTTLLWRKLIEDTERAQAQFTATSLWFLQLDYSGVMRLNFWFLSFVMLYITGRTQL